MITITKNNETKVVTKGAYEEFYKRLGFEIVGDKKPTFDKPVKEASIVEEKVKDDDKSNSIKGNRK